MTEHPVDEVIRRLERAKTCIPWGEDRARSATWKDLTRSIALLKLFRCADALISVPSRQPPRHTTPRRRSGADDLTDCHQRS